MSRATAAVINNTMREAFVASMREGFPTEVGARVAKSLKAGTGLLRAPQRRSRKRR